MREPPHTGGNRSETRRMRGATRVLAPAAAPDGVEAEEREAAEGEAIAAGRQARRAARAGRRRLGAGRADAVSVEVGLIGVRLGGAVVAGVEDLVVVDVGRARVAEPVVLIAAVGLVVVRGAGAVVAGVDVAVTVV